MQRFRIGTKRLQIEVCDLGARLNSVTFDGLAGLVFGSANREEALGAKKFNGAVVGPVANRIAGCEGEIGGQRYKFERNETDMTTLHSGISGIHAQDWTLNTIDDTFISLSLSLADGVGGFPGNRLLTSIYEVSGDSLSVRFEATSDAATWANLALHPYWTLGQNGRAGQRISVNADSYLPINAYKIPTGKIASVAGTQFDLRALGLPSFEIDHNFCLSGDAGPSVVLESDTGLRLEVKTDAPGVQVFTGKPIGIAIEPQHWPDAMHHPTFPGIELHRGEIYRQNSTYRFSRP